MEINKKQVALLYLEKKGFYYYQTGLQNIISLGFLETSVKDMDLINGATIVDQIKTFVGQYQISPAKITVVLSPNVTFEKDIVGLEKEEQDEMVKKFTDTIPFESVLSKTYPINKGVKVVGCNEELVSELKVSFEKNKFIVENIVPYQLLGSDQIFIQNLTPDNVSQFLKNIDRVKQLSMLSIEKAKIPSNSTQSSNNPAGHKKSNTRMYLMVGVFVILFAILSFMLLKR